MKLLMMKTPKGWAPANLEAQEEHSRQKSGQYIHGNFRKLRDPVKHRKFFALLNLAFDWWEPGEIDSKYGKPQKNFERFRKDLIILTGYFHIVVRLDGSTRPEADSISFATMDDDTFNDLYSKAIDVIIERITPNYTPEEINDMVLKIMEFA